MSRTVTIEVEIPDEEEIATGVALTVCEMSGLVISVNAMRQRKLSLGNFILLVGLSYVFDAIEGSVS